MRLFLLFCLLVIPLVLSNCGKAGDDSANLGQQSSATQGQCQVNPARLQIHHKKPFVVSVKIAGETVAPKLAKMYFQWNYPAKWGGLIFASDTNPFDSWTERETPSGASLQLQQVYAPKEDGIANQEMRALQSPVPIFHGVVVRTVSGRAVACEIPAEVMP